MQAPGPGAACAWDPPACMVLGWGEPGTRRLSPRKWGAAAIRCKERRGGALFPEAALP